MLWTNESKFEIFGPSIVFRKMHPGCITFTVKQGGESMMVWGCFSVGDLHTVKGILDQKGYYSILSRH